jgi:hypothetical protein
MEIGAQLKARRSKKCLGRQEQYVFVRNLLREIYGKNNTPS